MLKWMRFVQYKSFLLLDADQAIGAERNVLESMRHAAHP